MKLLMSYSTSEVLVRHVSTFWTRWKVQLVGSVARLVLKIFRTIKVIIGSMVIILVRGRNPVSDGTYVRATTCFVYSVNKRRWGVAGSWGSVNIEGLGESYGGCGFKDLIVYWWHPIKSQNDFLLGLSGLPGLQNGLKFWSPETWKGDEGRDLPVLVDGGLEGNLEGSLLRSKGVVLGGIVAIAITDASIWASEVCSSSLCSVTSS